MPNKPLLIHCYNYYYNNNYYYYINKSKTIIAVKQYSLINCYLLYDTQSCILSLINQLWKIDICTFSSKSNLATSLDRSAVGSTNQ